MSTPTEFISRLQPAPVGGGFSMDGYWVWCGSVVQGSDGRYHMFASRWTKEVSFNPHWITNSEVVRAVSDTPEGPYTFQEIVLPVRGAEHWDGLMTHNPTVHRCGDKYLLFYTGTTYDGDMPTRDNPIEKWGTPKVMQARAQQRIGMAYADSPEGPWTRLDAPVLQTREGKWDALITANPAPCVLPDQSILLVYKSVAFDGDLIRLGVAKAESYTSEFKRLQDEPILRFDDTGNHVEDPYVWHNGNSFELIMKDMVGGLCGELGGGVHALSDDGIHWRLAPNPKAYSRTVTWDDGTTTKQASFERPQLLLQGGKPTHLFAATGLGGEGFALHTSWNMVIPLCSSES